MRTRQKDRVKTQPQMRKAIYLTVPSSLTKLAGQIRHSETCLKSLSFSRTCQHRSKSSWRTCSSKIWRSLTSLMRIRVTLSWRMMKASLRRSTSSTVMSDKGCIVDSQSRATVHSSLSTCDGRWDCHRSRFASQA